MAVPIRKNSTRPNAPAVDRRAGNKAGRVTAPRRYRMLWRSMRTSELISHSEIESVVAYRAALALDVRFQDHVLMRPIIYADVGLILVAVGATAGFVVPRIVAREDAEPRSDFIRRFNVPATLLVATHRLRPGAVKEPRRKQCAQSEAALIKYSLHFKQGRADILRAQSDFLLILRRARFFLAGPACPAQASRVRQVFRHCLC